MMKYKNFAIGVVLAIVLVAAWYMLLWKPQFDSLATKRENNASLDSEKAKLDTQLAQLRALKREEAAMRADFVKLEMAVPNEPELESFLFELHRTAAESGVEIQSASFSQPAPAVVGAAPAAPGAATTTTTTTTAPAQPAEGAAAAPAAAAPTSNVSVMQISLNVKGSYFQLLDFLDRTKSDSRVIVYDSLTLTAGEGGGSLTVALTGRIFTTATASAAAAPGGAGAPGTSSPPGGAPAPTPQGGGAPAPTPQVGGAPAP